MTNSFENSIKNTKTSLKIRHEKYLLEENENVKGLVLNSSEADNDCFSYETSTETFDRTINLFEKSPSHIEENCCSVTKKHIFEEYKSKFLYTKPEFLYAFPQTFEYNKLPLFIHTDMVRCKKEKNNSDVKSEKNIPRGSSVKAVHLFKIGSKHGSRQKIKAKRKSNTKIISKSQDLSIKLSTEKNINDCKKKPCLKVKQEPDRKAVSTSVILGISNSDKTSQTANSEIRLRDLLGESIRYYNTSDKEIQTANVKKRDQFIIIQNSMHKIPRKITINANKNYLKALTPIKNVCRPEIKEIEPKIQNARMIAKPLPAIETIFLKRYIKHGYDRNDLDNQPRKKIRKLSTVESLVQKDLNHFIRDTKNLRKSTLELKNASLFKSWFNKEVKNEENLTNKFVEIKEKVLGATKNTKKEVKSRQEEEQLPQVSQSDKNRLEMVKLSNKFADRKKISVPKSPQKKTEIVIKKVFSQKHQKNKKPSNVNRQQPNIDNASKGSTDKKKLQFEKSKSFGVYQTLILQKNDLKNKGLLKEVCNLYEIHHFKIFNNLFLSKTKVSTLKSYKKSSQCFSDMNIFQATNKIKSVTDKSIFRSNRFDVDIDYKSKIGLFLKYLDSLAYPKLISIAEKAQLCRSNIDMWDKISFSQVFRRFRGDRIRDFQSLLRTKFVNKKANLGTVKYFVQNLLNLQPLKQVLRTDILDLIKLQLNEIFYRVYKMFLHFIGSKNTNVFPKISATQKHLLEFSRNRRFKWTGFIKKEEIQLNKPEKLKNEKYIKHFKKTELTQIIKQLTDEILTVIKKLTSPQNPPGTGKWKCKNLSILSEINHFTNTTKKIDTNYDQKLGRQSTVTRTSKESLTEMQRTILKLDLCRTLEIPGQSDDDGSITKYENKMKKMNFYKNIPKRDLFITPSEKNSKIFNLYKNVRETMNVVNIYHVAAGNDAREQLLSNPVIEKFEEVRLKTYETVRQKSRNLHETIKTTNWDYSQCYEVNKNKQPSRSVVQETIAKSDRPGDQMEKNVTTYKLDVEEKARDLKGREQIPLKPDTEKAKEVHLKTLEIVRNKSAEPHAITEITDWGYSQFYEQPFRSRVEKTLTKYDQINDQIKNQVSADKLDVEEKTGELKEREEEPPVQSQEGRPPEEPKVFFNLKARQQSPSKSVTEIVEEVRLKPLETVWKKSPKPHEINESKSDQPVDQIEDNVAADKLDVKEREEQPPEEQGQENTPEETKEDNQPKESQEEKLPEESKEEKPPEEPEQPKEPPEESGDEKPYKEPEEEKKSEKPEEEKQSEEPEKEKPSKEPGEGKQAEILEEENPLKEPGPEEIPPKKPGEEKPSKKPEEELPSEKRQPEKPPEPTPEQLACQECCQHIEEKQKLCSKPPARVQKKKVTLEDLLRKKCTPEIENEKREKMKEVHSPACVKSKPLSETTEKIKQKPKEKEKIQDSRVCKVYGTLLAKETQQVDRVWEHDTTCWEKINSSAQNNESKVCKNFGKSYPLKSDPTIFKRVENRFRIKSMQDQKVTGQFINNYEKTCSLPQPAKEDEFCTTDDCMKYDNFGQEYSERLETQQCDKNVCESKNEVDNYISNTGAEQSCECSTVSSNEKICGYSGYNTGVDQKKVPSINNVFNKYTSEAQKRGLPRAFMESKASDFQQDMSPDINISQNTKTNYCQTQHKCAALGNFFEEYVIYTPTQSNTVVNCDSSVPTIENTIEALCNCNFNIDLENKEEKHYSSANKKCLGQVRNGNHNAKKAIDEPNRFYDVDSSQKSTKCKALSNPESENNNFENTKKCKEIEICAGPSNEEEHIQLPKNHCPDLCSNKEGKSIDILYQNLVDRKKFKSFQYSNRPLFSSVNDKKSNQWVSNKNFQLFYKSKGVGTRSKTQDKSLQRQSNPRNCQSKRVCTSNNLESANAIKGVSSSFATMSCSYMTKTVVDEQTRFKHQIPERKKGCKVNPQSCQYVQDSLPKPEVQSYKNSPEKNKFEIECPITLKRTFNIQRTYQPNLKIPNKQDITANKKHFCRYCSEQERLKTKKIESLGQEINCPNLSNVEENKSDFNLLRSIICDEKCNSSIFGFNYKTISETDHRLLEQVFDDYCHDPKLRQSEKVLKKRNTENQNVCLNQNRRYCVQTKKYTLL